MKSTTSFYNKAFVKSNVKRFGFFGLIFFIVTATISNLGIMLNTVDQYRPSVTGVKRFVLYPTPWEIAMVYIVPVVFGIVLFRYIMEEKALATIHAMPVSRKSLFGSQFVTFQILYTIPVALNSLIALTILLFKDYPMGEALSRSLGGMFWLVVTGTAVFAFTVLMGMLLGSSVLQVALTYIMMGAPFILVELARVLVGWTLKGFPGNSGNIGLHTYLTPYYAIAMTLSNGMDDVAVRYYSMAVVVAMLIGSLGLSWFFYKRRDLERHHDLIAFTGAKIFFSTILTAMVTLALASLVGSLMEEQSFGVYVGLVIGAFVGFAIMKMISEKTLAVYKYWKQALVVVAGSVLILVTVDLDLFGYEERQPTTDDVAYVYYSESGYLNDISYKAMEESLDNSYVGGGILLESGSIDLVKELHTTMISEELPRYSTWQQITLVYVLKNGKRIHRVYNGEIDQVLIGGLHELPEYKASYLERMNKVFAGAQEDDISLNVPGAGGVTLKAGEVKGFLAAYSNDYARMSYLEEIGYYELGNMEVSVLEKVYYQYGEKVENRRYYSYAIKPSFEQSKQWLKMNGYEDVLPEGKDIISATISKDYNQFIPYEERFIDYGQVDTPVATKESGFYTQNTVTEPELLDELWSLGYDFTRPYDPSYVIDYRFEDGSSYRVRVVDLPSKFLSYISEW